MECALGDFPLALVSSERFSSQPASSPMLTCRGRPSPSPKQAKCDSPWFHEDIWICIMTLLDAKSLLRLAVTNRQLCALAMDDMIWKSVFLRDIGNRVSIDTKPTFSWMNLYLAACDGSHTFSHFETEKHIDWMRIGVFCLESGEAIATDKLMEVKLVSEKESNSESDTLLLKAFAISNVKKGLWIADLHLMHCPVCNLATCEGTMQALDVRHWELFLSKEYKTREWKFEQVCPRLMAGPCNEAVACIVDASQLRNKETQGMTVISGVSRRDGWSSLLSLIHNTTEPWIIEVMEIHVSITDGLLNFSRLKAAPGNWRPKGVTSSLGVAACTNLQPNQGLKVKFQTMKAGTEGPIVAIRVCQQLA